MTFSGIPNLFSSPPHSSVIIYYFPSSLIKAACFSLFPPQITCTLPFQSLLLHFAPTVFPLHFANFCSYSNYILTSADLELGFTVERDLTVFVFLYLDCLTQYYLY